MKNTKGLNKILISVVIFILLMAGLLLSLVLTGNVKILGSENKKDVKGAEDVKVCEDNLKNDDLYLESSRKWFLRNYADDTTSDIKLFIKPEEFSIPTEVYFVNSKTLEKIAVTKVSEKEFIYLPQTLPADSYTFYAVAKNDCYEVQSNTVDFNVSEPVMVLWTQDWEGDDVKQAYLDDLARISKQYGVVMTHYWNPRIYIDGTMSEARQTYLTNWIKDRRDNHGEEIGLHIHMFTNLVKHLGLPELPERWGQRTDGYDRLVGQYSTKDFAKVLAWADREFAANGLAKPTNFRAGGWFTSQNTMAALSQNGYQIESSGRDKYTIGANKKPGYWSLSDISQPYYPAKTNQNSQNLDFAQNWNLIEVPNNAGNTWEHSAETIIDRFNKNYPGGVATKPVIFNILSHPHWHYMDGPKLDKIFIHTKSYNYTNDTGPVVYMTMEDSVAIWKLSQ